MATKPWRVPRKKGPVSEKKGSPKADPPRTIEDGPKLYELEAVIRVSESDAYELRQFADRFGVPLRALIDLTASLAYSWCLPSVGKQMGAWQEAKVQQEAVKGFGKGPVELPISTSALLPLKEVADAINVSVETPIMEAYHRLMPWLRQCPKDKGTSMCETYTAICTTQKEWMGRTK